MRGFLDIGRLRGRPVTTRGRLSGFRSGSSGS